MSGFGQILIIKIDVTISLKCIEKKGPYFLTSQNYEGEYRWWGNDGEFANGRTIMIRILRIFYLRYIFIVIWDKYQARTWNKIFVFSKTNF